VQLFDLWTGFNKYPLEYIIEALARLPSWISTASARETADLSPDPGDSHPRLARRSLVSSSSRAITRTKSACSSRHHRHGDVAAQVFALADSGDVQIGLICSEKQAIDATLRSLSRVRIRASVPCAHTYLERASGQQHRRGTFESSPSRRKRD